MSDPRNPVSSTHVFEGGLMFQFLFYNVPVPCFVESSRDHSIARSVQPASGVSLSDEHEVMHWLSLVPAKSMVRQYSWCPIDWF